MSKGSPSDFQRRLRRLDFAARSKPAEKRESGEPSGLISGTHARGYLPHVKVLGATYFVTFRLADSLPQNILKKLIHEAEEKAKAANQKVVQNGEPPKYRPEDFINERVEYYLDARHGKCWLKRPEVASVVAGAIKHFEGARYHLHAWVVMPNHVHTVLRPVPDFSLSSILHTWKSFTAKEVNKLLPEEVVPFWQKESFDRWCRDDKETEHWISYTHLNPVNARLCKNPEDWPWSKLYRKP
jgi:REP element-mobilizing transposase RayT